MNYDRLMQLSGIDRPIAPIPQYITKEELKSDIDNINEKIPEDASSENQLSSDNYVNDKVSTDSATFRETWNLVTDLHLSVSATQLQTATALASVITTADNNDYCYVQVPKADETPTKIDRVDRYKYNGTAWYYEYSPTTIIDVKSDIADVVDSMEMDDTNGDITIQYDDGQDDNNNDE